MSIKKISVKGIRSFKNESSITLAIPDYEKIGSGFNMLVGPNNSGKSSLIETIYLTNNRGLSFIPNEIRNKENNIFHIEIATTNDYKFTLKSNENNPGSVVYTCEDLNGNEINNYDSIAYVISPKRNIEMSFYSSFTSRNDFENNNSGINYRKSTNLNNIGGRFADIILNYKSIFDKELEYILDYLPKWSLESDDGSQFYIAFNEGNTIHSNSGSGDGFINLFIILTAIYDAPKGSTIIIDEPELSLHPDVQKRLMNRLLYHSKNLQIIISTHSPYFIDLNTLNNGGKLFRFQKENNDTKIYTIKEENIRNVISLLNSIEQPYLQDIKSKEIFFLDKIIIVEGVDDIYGYEHLFKKYNYYTTANFYGWGLGGASKIKNLLPILEDLGYKKILILLDGNMNDLSKSLCTSYPQYKFLNIEANDIRSKTAPNLSKINTILSNLKKSGISNESVSALDLFLKEYTTDLSTEGVIINRTTLDVNPKYENNIQYIINEIKEYFQDSCQKNPLDDFIESDTYSQLDLEKKAKKILDDFIKKYPEKTDRYLFSEFKEYNLDGGSGGGYSLINKNNNIYTFKLQSSACFEKIGIKKSTIIINVNLDNPSDYIHIVSSKIN